MKTENSFLNQFKQTNLVFNRYIHQIQIDFETVNTNLMLEEPFQQGERCRCVQCVHNVQSTGRDESIVMVTAISIDKIYTPRR